MPMRAKLAPADLELGSGRLLADPGQQQMQQQAITVGSDEDAAAAAGTDSLSLIQRQVVLLFRKQFTLKRRAWKWTLLEIFFPLQPVFFLWLTFTLGSGFIPYNKEVTPPKASQPPQLLANTSGAGLLGLMYVGGSIGFTPASGSMADMDAARALHALFCGGYTALRGAPQVRTQIAHYEGIAQQMATAQCSQDPASMQCKILSSAGSTSPGRCLWFKNSAAMDHVGGWFPFAGQMPGNAGPKLDADALYIGVEVGERSLLLRHEELILVDDANGDPEEQNTIRSGVLALQAAAGGALMLHSSCPTQTAACDERCVASLVEMGLKCAESSTSTSTSAVSQLGLGLDPICVGTYMLTQATSAERDLNTCVMSQLPHLSPSLQLLNPAALYVEEFPVAGSTKLLNFRKFMYPFMFLTVLFLNVQATLTLLGEEKEHGIKDALSLKGMRRTAFWITWFLSQATVMTASCLVVAIAARAFLIIEHTSIVHFGLVLWLYGCCLISMAFLISSFFKTSKAMFVVAVILLIFIGAIAYVVELLMIRRGVSYMATLCTFLFAPIPYGHLLWILSSGELQGQGWQYGLTLAEWPRAVNDYYYEAHVFIVIDAVLYLGLAILVDQAISDPLSFGRTPVQTDEQLAGLELLSTTKPAANGGIEIHALCKRFSWKEKVEGWRGAVLGQKVEKSVQAVDKLELFVPERTIFCLLGSNGAGKTTTMGEWPTSLTPHGCC
jgi:ABC-type transport system involved in multi-copper enzyme maturation permease subunit